MADFANIGNSFVQHYYSQFDNAGQRPNLASLYRPESMLTWEGQQYQGVQNIMAAINKPELANVRHAVSTTDCHPAPGGGVLCTITGNLAFGDALDKPMLFTQTFNLQPIPNQPGGFFVYNDLFRLVFQ